MLWYLVATAGVFVVCFLAYRSRPAKYADLMGVSALLAVVFAMGNLFLAMFRFPEALLSFPVLDLAFAALVYRAWQKNREPWKVVIVAALAAQLMLHLLAIGQWKAGALTQWELYMYVVGINGFFIVQLLTLGSVGAGHGLGLVRRWLHDRRGVSALSDARQ